MSESSLSPAQAFSSQTRLNFEISVTAMCSELAPDVKDFVLDLQPFVWDGLIHALCDWL